MSDLEINKSFEEKMKDRVKESIGDLISDEDLSKIVEKGIEETFFKATPSSYQVPEKPALIVNILKDCLQESVKKEVRAWIKKNPDKMGDLIKESIEKDISEVVMSSISNVFSNVMYNFRCGMENEIHSIIQNRG